MSKMPYFCPAKRFYSAFGSFVIECYYPKLFTMLKKYQAIDAQLFVENRQRLAAQLPEGAIAILTANDESPRSADGFHPFRQNSDLFYLTGIDQEDTILVLFPSCPQKEWREVLFIRPTDEHIAVWEGHKYTKEEARTASGIQKIIWADEFDTNLPNMMYLAESCYLNTNEHTRMRTRVLDHDHRFALEMRQRYPLHTFRRLAPILHRLRAVKSEAEINLMRQAIAITGAAFRRVLQFVQPGVAEYEVEAEVLHTYIRQRATGPAYGSIIASGKNACVLHYVANNQTCENGDLLLMDFGAEYANYAADLTRTIPVNGKFSPRQKAVYEAVLCVLKAARQMLKPGVLLDDYHREVGLIMEKELIGLGLLDAEAVANQKPNEMPLYKKYFMHGTSHFLGLDVHDVGLKHLPIEAGMVFTCEPGIYIPEEGIGIRIENDIVVMPIGQDNIDLMDEAHIPMEVDEIEALMQR
jgi:Xaa-Pro aminopeptidase